MSHFAKYDVKGIKELDLLEKALKYMGLNSQRNIQVSTGFGESMHADLGVFNSNHEALPIAFTKNSSEGIYELTADWYRTKFNSKTFTEGVSQNYSRAKVERSLESTGWSIEDTSVNENGEVEILALSYN